MVKYDFPDPDDPNIHVFEFLYFSLSNLSIIISELLLMSVPYNIPCSSYIVDVMNGYVPFIPSVNMFLFTALLIS